MCEGYQEVKLGEEDGMSLFFLGGLKGTCSGMKTKKGGRENAEAYV